jgi:hypothetical protein
MGMYGPVCGLFSSLRQLENKSGDLSGGASESCQYLLIAHDAMNKIWPYMRMTCQCECRKSMKSNVNPGYAVSKGGGRERKTRNERQNRWMTTSNDVERWKAMSNDGRR